MPAGPRRPSARSHSLHRASSAYSLLNTTAGSIRDARQAGIQPARSPTAASIRTDPTSTPGSDPWTIHSQLMAGITPNANVEWWLRSRLRHCFVSVRDSDEVGGQDSTNIPTKLVTPWSAAVYVMWQAA